MPLSLWKPQVSATPLPNTARQPVATSISAASRTYVSGLVATRIPRNSPAKGALLSSTYAPRDHSARSGRPAYAGSRPESNSSSHEATPATNPVTAMK